MSNRVVMDTSALRVLVVDDVDDLRHLVTLSLERTAAVDVVGEASNGAEALELVAELRPDVVVMDLVMPVMDGADATRQIVSRFPDVAVVGFTSSEGNGVRRMIAAGAVAAIEKTDFTDLIELLSRGRAAFG